MATQPEKLSPPLSLDSLPTSINDPDYLHAAELVSTYHYAAHTWPKDWRTEFISHLKSKDFVVNVRQVWHRLSKTKEKLGQVVGSRLTWPKWVILMTIYGPDHESLQHVSREIVKRFPHCSPGNPRFRGSEEAPPVEERWLPQVDEELKRTWQQKQAAHSENATAVSNKKRKAADPQEPASTQKKKQPCAVPSGAGGMDTEEVSHPTAEQVTAQAGLRAHPSSESPSLFGYTSTTKASGHGLQAKQDSALPQVDSLRDGSESLSRNNPVEEHATSPSITSGTKRNAEAVEVIDHDDDDDDEAARRARAVRQGLMKSTLERIRHHNASQIRSSASVDGKVAKDIQTALASIDERISGIERRIERNQKRMDERMCEVSEQMDVILLYIQMVTKD